MKRIACKACGRQRWAHPRPGQGADVLRTTSLRGRDVKVSRLEATEGNCRPCRRKLSRSEPQAALRAKVYGEMTRVVVRKAKEEATDKKKRRYS